MTNEQVNDRGDWRTLPEELSYVISDAEKYGRLRDDYSRRRRIATLSDSERARLTKIASRVRHDYVAMQFWIDERELHPASARLYWFMVFLQEAIPEQPSTVRLVSAEDFRPILDLIADSELRSTDAGALMKTLGMRLTKEEPGLVDAQDAEANQWTLFLNSDDTVRRIVLNIVLGIQADVVQERATFESLISNRLQAEGLVESRVGVVDRKAWKLPIGIMAVETLSGASPAVEATLRIVLDLPGSETGK